MLVALLWKEQGRGSVGRSRLAWKEEVEVGENDSHLTWSWEDHLDWKEAREKNNIRQHCKTYKAMESPQQRDREGWLVSLRCSSWLGSDLLH